MDWYCIYTTKLWNSIGFFFYTNYYLYVYKHSIQCSIHEAYESCDDFLQGRNLLQDMLLVLHLEMELRRRAIDRFSSTAAGNNVLANQMERDRHMTEVLAIQEQMQEITGFLNILFSIPPEHR